MKRFRSVAVLAASAGLFALVFAGFRTLQLPVHAQAAPASSAAQAPTPPGLVAADAAGSKSYEQHCAICHGEQREGILPAFPPLIGIKRQMSDAQITELIRKGRGRMPGFPKVSDSEVASLLGFLATIPTSVPAMAPATNAHFQLTGEAAAGGSLFLQNCAFCHGRDAMGGETGPDLTQSKLVLEDKDGTKISEVVRTGRNENDKKMPAFQFSSQELNSLVAFIRAREVAAAAMKGGRRGVSVEDLQTGNAEAGKEYFNGAGGCSKCHSPTGDLAGLARRYEGLRLEERMLYPRDAKSTVVVTLPSGKTISGTLAYQDEFTIGLKDSAGSYHSWSVDNVKYKVDSPVEAHVEQFPKYTDDDVHNLMKYLQTLK